MIVIDASAAIEWVLQTRKGADVEARAESCECPSCLGRLKLALEHRLTNRQRATFEIKHGPAQRQQLADPQSRCRYQTHHRAMRFVDEVRSSVSCQL